MEEFAIEVCYLCKRLRVAMTPGRNPWFTIAIVIVIALDTLLYSFTISHCLQPLRHFLNFSINQILAYLSPSLSNQHFLYRVIPMCIFTSVYLGNYPKVLYHYQIPWGLRVVKTTLKSLRLFPLSHWILFTGAMTRITIFLQCKIMTSHYPGLNNRFRTRVIVHLVCYFPVFIPWNVVEYDVRLEIVSHRCPTVLALLIFFFTWRQGAVLYTIKTIACA